MTNDEFHCGLGYMPTTLAHQALAVHCQWGIWLDKHPVNEPPCGSGLARDGAHRPVLAPIAAKPAPTKETVRSHFMRALEN
ncbi:MAG: hypothetical protein Q4G71_06750 [Pseudomonadota bacterium]|nr:hypothetical protein [Pseudomonadota bacterium]